MEIYGKSIGIIPYKWLVLSLINQPFRKKLIGSIPYKWLVLSLINQPFRKKRLVLSLVNQAFFDNPHGKPQFLTAKTRAWRCSAAAMKAVAWRPVRRMRRGEVMGKSWDPNSRMVNIWFTGLWNIWMIMVYDWLEYIYSIYVGKIYWNIYQIFIHIWFTGWWLFYLHIPTLMVYGIYEW